MDKSFSETTNVDAIAEQDDNHRYFTYIREARVAAVSSDSCECAKDR